MQRRSASGFTLLELMVVVIIIGLGWFLLLPKLDVLNAGKVETRLDSLNAFLAEARAEAMAGGRIQELFLEIGEEKMKWGKDKVYLFPVPVSSCFINDANPQGLTFPFRVYPDGVMDGVRIELRSRDILRSEPLVARFRVEAAFGDLMSEANP